MSGRRRNVAERVVELLRPRPLCTTATTDCVLRPPHCSLYRRKCNNCLREGHASHFLWQLDVLFEWMRQQRVLFLGIRDAEEARWVHLCFDGVHVDRGNWPLARSEWTKNCAIRILGRLFRNGQAQTEMRLIWIKDPNLVHPNLDSPLGSHPPHTVGWTSRSNQWDDLSRADGGQRYSLCQRLHMVDVATATRHSQKK